MTFHIRRAVSADCPQLLELIRELALYEKAPEEVTVTLSEFRESGFGENPVWWAFVATIPGTAPGDAEQIVGFALYYIRYSTWKGQVMYLEDILVTSSMRGQGIGRKLFDTLVEEAGQRKLKRIVWQVLDWNEPAIRFYTKLQARFDPEWVNCTLDIQ